MIIGVDATVLTRSKKTGVDYYTRNVVAAAIAALPRDRFALCHFGGRPPELPGRAANVSFHSIRRPSFRLYRWLFRAGVAPAFDRLADVTADVFLFPDFVSLPIANAPKTALVVHDLAFRRYGHTLPFLFRWYLRIFVARSIRRADQIIAISQSTKRELMALYNLKPDNIAVIPPGVDTNFFSPRPPQEITGVLAKYGISQPYILYFGTLEPRKNIVGILDAYAALPPATRQKYRLVLAGGKGWLDHDIQRRLQQLSHLGIITPGYITEADAPSLYAGATAFVYPSLYEGFGMPPLEAMACGVPVITSDNSSLPEVVGDAGITVAAKDTQALSNAMQRVLSDPKLAADLRQKGLKRAKQFSWERSGRQLADLLQTLAKS